MSDRSASLTSPSARDSVCEYRYMMPVSGSYDPPGQLAPFGTNKVACRPFSPRTIGGVKTGPVLYCETISSAAARSSGVKSMSSSSRTSSCRSSALPLERGRCLVGNGCVGAYHSPDTFPAGTGRSSIGQTGSPVTRSNT